MAFGDNFDIIACNFPQSHVEGICKNGFIEAVLTSTLYIFVVWWNKIKLGAVGGGGYVTEKDGCLILVTPISFSSFT